MSASPTESKQNDPRSLFTTIIIQNYQGTSVTTRLVRNLCSAFMFLDGIVVGEDAIVEVKCPSTAFETPSMVDFIQNTKGAVSSCRISPVFHMHAVVYA